MSLTFYIPGPLRAFTDEREQVEIETRAATLRDALDALWGRYPALRDRILTEQGEVRQHINVFVGNESIQYTGGLATPVPDRAVIMIVPAVSGGTADR